MSKTDTSKAKPHKHAELIKAWADGAEIQVQNDDGSWEDVTPLWNQHHKYRIKPEIKKLYMHEPVLLGGQILDFGSTFDNDAHMDKHLEFVFVDGKLAEVNMKPATNL